MQFMDMVYGYIRKVYINLDQGTVCLVLLNGKPVRFGTNLFTHPFIPGAIKSHQSTYWHVFKRRHSIQRVSQAWD